MNNKNRFIKYITLAVIIYALTHLFIWKMAPPIDTPKLYINYNPVTEVSQERLDAWRELAQKTAKKNQERGETIEALERQIEKEETNNTRLHELNSNNVSRATKRITTKTNTQTYTQGVEQWRPLVKKYFKPEYVNNALSVMQGESRGNPTAKNPNSSASGLFQHLARYWEGRSAKAGWAGASIFDPEANIAVASWLSNGGANWGHWVVKP